MWVSKDNGVNWRKADINNTPWRDSVLQVYAQGKTIYAVASDWLVISHDDGVNWTKYGYEQGLLHPNISGFAVEGETLYVTNKVYSEHYPGDYYPGGISISRDSGNSWTNLPFPDRWSAEGVYAQGDDVYMIM